MSSKAKGKRRAEADTAPPVDDDGEALVFEDECGDEVEEEEFYEERQGEDGEDSGEEEAVDASELLGADGVHAEVEGQLWRAGDGMAANERLDYDSSAYDMLHRMHVEWPSLTFGFVKDSLGEQRTAFPMTAYMVSGTQAERANQNQLVCQKLSQLAKTRHDEDSESDDDSDDDADDDPIVEHQTVPHSGTVNRLKLMPQSPHVCATWSDTGKVFVHNLAAPLATLASPGSAAAAQSEASRRPLFSFGGHAEEGYALDWSAARPGALASGDNAHKLHVWAPTEGGSWAVDPEPLCGHTGAVEDVAWSPVEPNVLMSVGCDSTVRVWDVRRKGGSALTVDEKHGCDVNVLSWNKLVNYLVVTGADDGSFRVWDLRSFSSAEPVANFKWHKGAVTSLEWSPHESSTLAVAGADDQLTLCATRRRARMRATPDARRSPCIPCAAHRSSHTARCVGCVLALQVGPGARGRPGGRLGGARPRRPAGHPAAALLCPPGAGGDQGDPLARAAARRARIDRRRQLPRLQDRQPRRRRRRVSAGAALAGSLGSGAESARDAESA